MPSDHTIPIINKFKYAAICTSAVLTLTGCSTSPVSTSRSNNSAASFPSAASGTICVIQPPDFDNSPESGSEVSKKVLEALESLHRSSVAILSGPDARTKCREAGSETVLQTKIVVYEDNFTGWSGKLDRIELKVSLSPVMKPDAKRSTTYEAHSDFVHSAMFEWGNAKPYQLLQSDFNYTIEKLLRETDSDE